MKRKSTTRIIALFCIMLSLTWFIPEKILAGIPSEIVGIENDTGSSVFDNTVGIGADKLGDKAIDIAKEGLESAPDSSKWVNVGRAGKLIKYGAFVIGVVDTARDAVKLWGYKSKHSTESERNRDKALYILNTGLSALGIVATTVAIFNPASAAAGGAVAVMSGTGYALVTAGVSVSRSVYNSQTFGDATDFMKGKKKLVFAPYERPEIKEGRKIIEEELGFELYPGLRREIPDPNTGIPVYKPNIYIYNDVDTKVNVKIYPAHYITESIPLYNEEKGWNAEVVKGSINGVNDFLFYEALVPDEGFQKNYGFTVRQKYLKEDMMRILKEYKFNEKESKDFLEYWQDKLKGTDDFIFYPEEKEIVDNCMPIFVTPKPAKIYRIWFYIVPKGDKVVAQKPVKEIDRGGYLIVEWGGIYKNNN